MKSRGPTLLSYFGQGRIDRHNLVTRQDAQSGPHSPHGRREIPAMTDSRLYVIEIKDAETGVSEFVTTVDWTANQKLVAVTLFSRLSERDANRYEAHAEVEHTN